MVGTGGADDMASKMKKCLAQFQLEDIPVHEMMPKMVI